MTAGEISWPTQTPSWAEDSIMHWSNVTVNAQLCFSTHMERFGSDWRWFSPWRRRLSTLPEPETTGGRAPLHKKEKTQSFRVKALTSKLNILEEPVKTYKRPIKDLYKTYSRPIQDHCEEVDAFTQRTSLSRTFTETQQQTWRNEHQYIQDFI